MKNLQARIKKTRTRIIARAHLTLLKIFDTCEKESGSKDVALCRTPQGKKVIVRIGEIRPKHFFPKGCRGRHFFIPNIIKTLRKNIPYEIEEYIDGTLAAEINKGGAKGRVSVSLLPSLLSAFWEFQVKSKEALLEKKFGTEKILNHYQHAQKFLPHPHEVKKIIIDNKNFWEKGYPSKWKFALDNLIITKHEKIAFIDNAGAGLRPFAYDLGWLIWPLWLSMSTDEYRNTKKYLLYLERFKNLAFTRKPRSYALNRASFNHAFWCIVFERAIGALFDMEQNTKHLATHKLGRAGTRIRNQNHILFLNTILTNAMKYIGNRDYIKSVNYQTI